MSLLTAEHINLDLAATSQEGVIRELAKELFASGHVSDLEQFVADTMAREALGPTGIGHGIAIPHGKSAAVQTPAIAFGRSVRGLEWNSLDEEPVKLVFLLAVPEQSADNYHLKVLAALARKLIHVEFRDKLTACNDKEKLVSLLGGITIQ